MQLFTAETKLKPQAGQFLISLVIPQVELDQPINQPELEEAVTKQAVE